MRCVALAAAALVLACSGSSIELTLAPTLSSAAEVAGRVEVIEVVVSSPDGLAGVTQAGPRAAGGRAFDWNGDGVLEVVFSVPHHHGADLPVLEFGLNDNRGRSLEFRVLGFSSGDVTVPPVAFGGTALAAGSTSTKLGVPFDLRSEARPPQVVLTLPADGSKVPLNLAAVTLAFSTTIDAETLSAATLTGVGGPAEVVPTIETVTLLKGDPLEEHRSLLSLRLVHLLRAGTYTLAVGEGLRSTAGFSAVPFVSHFSGEARGGAGASPDGGACSCPPGYHCTAELQDCAVDVRCGGGCGGGYLCDELEARCVEDCRRLGLCPSAAGRCDSATGFCR